MEQEPVGKYGLDLFRNDSDDGRLWFCITRYVGIRLEFLLDGAGKRQAFRLRRDAEVARDKANEEKP